MVSLRPALPSDLALIRNLAVQIWNVHYPPIIGQQQVDYMLERMYGEAALKQHLEHGPQQFFLVWDEDHALGFIAIADHENGHGYLQKFYVLPTKQSSGLGSQAWELLRKARPEFHTWRLQVNRQNYKAINFYFKMGFRIEKVADFDIGDGYVMNDFVMLLKD